MGLCNGADEAWFWDLVLLAPSPDTAKHISDEKLKELIQRHRIRRIKIHAVQDVLKGAHLAAAAGVCEGAAWQAKLLVAQLQLLSTQERAAAAEVTAALRDLPKTEGAMNDAEIIMSAPGFAEHTTGVLLAEAGAVLARRDSLELRAVCGVAPVTKSSGKRRTKSKWTKNQNVDGVVVMRRAVNMRLRNAVHHAGNTASRDPRFAPMYARLRASGANHARAVRGVADRLLGVLIGMLRNQTLYQPAATTT